MLRVFPSTSIRVPMKTGRDSLVAHAKVVRRISSFSTALETLKVLPSFIFVICG